MKNSFAILRFCDFQKFGIEGLTPLLVWVAVVIALSTHLAYAKTTSLLGIAGRYTNQTTYSPIACTSPSPTYSNFDPVFISLPLSARCTFSGIDMLA